jgi:hypothetical protein
MGRIVYDVPLVTQAQNPICWVACMAMVASERRGYSVGVGYYASGFDPSSSSIPNPALSQNEVESRLNRLGFSNVAPNSNNDELENVLRNCGPFILSHNCNGFPYGAGWTPLTAGRHAVVITGYDSSVSGGTFWMNNPWGNKDRAVPASAVTTAITQMEQSSLSPVAYLRMT